MPLDQPGSGHPEGLHSWDGSHGTVTKEDSVLIRPPVTERYTDSLLKCTAVFRRKRPICFFRSFGLRRVGQTYRGQWRCSGIRGWWPQAFCSPFTSLQLTDFFQDGSASLSGALILRLPADASTSASSGSGFSEA